MQTLQHDCFRVDFEPSGVSSQYHEYYKYRFYDLEYSEEPIFEGADLGMPRYARYNQPWDVFYALAGYCTLKDGDIEDEYFKDYTPTQLEWRDTRAEYAQGVTSELEEMDIEEAS